MKNRTNTQMCIRDRPRDPAGAGQERDEPGGEGGALRAEKRALSLLYPADDPRGDFARRVRFSAVRAGRGLPNRPGQREQEQPSDPGAPGACLLYTSFEERGARYRALASAALARLLDAGLVLEVNTGAISRGWRQDPYPADFLLRQALQAGGRVAVTADALSLIHISFRFPALSYGFYPVFARLLGLASTTFLLHPI